MRLLVAYQLMADFLDSTNERGACAGIANGRQLHLALLDALHPDREISDHFHHHPWRDDCGYLRLLIQTCREGYASLPSCHSVSALASRAATHALVLGINHELDPGLRDSALKEWARREFPEEHQLSWFELSAAASAWLTILALLALAGEPQFPERDVLTVYAAYLPWISLLGTMLDSYADRNDDLTNGDHSYIAHYPTPDVAQQRIRGLIRRSTRRAHALPNGATHTVILASMIAMYLSKNSTGTPTRSPVTRSLVRSGDPLVRALIPVLRIWRRIYDPSPKVKPTYPAGPRSHPVAQTLAFAYRPAAYLDRCSTRYGRRFTLRPINFPPLVFLSDPTDVKALFKASPDVLHPGKGGAVIEPLVGANSFMLKDGEEHRNGRKIILPAFHSGIILQAAGALNETLMREVASWPLDTPVALHPRLRALTLRIILNKIFTPTLATTGLHLPALHERLLATLDVTASAVLSEPILRHGPGHRTWRRFLRARAEADELIHTLIDERQAATGEPRDVLDTLLAAHDTQGRPLSRERIRDDLMSLILAGHETTASQLAWAFQLLAHHPHVQARLIDEIDHDEHQEYLSATVHEVLRHRPVFLFAIPRAVKQPFELGGITYHPPTRLLACIYLIHHDPETYPQPHVFRPERFLEGPLVPASAWLPWGGGRKRCPGVHLALLEIQIVLRAVLSHATVHPASRRIEHARWRSVIVTPHAGSRVILRARATPRRRIALDPSTPAAAEVPPDANLHDRQTDPAL